MGSAGLACFVFTLWTATGQIVLGQEDLLAMESQGNLGTVAVAPPADVMEGMEVEHRGDGLAGSSLSSKPKKRRNFNVHVNRQVSRQQSQRQQQPESVGNPLSDIGYQIGEYMRRMSDYVYWFVSGRAPITRKRNNPSVRESIRRASQGAQGVRVLQIANRRVSQERWGQPASKPAVSQSHKLNRRKLKTPNRYEGQRRRYKLLRHDGQNKS